MKTLISLVFVALLGISLMAQTPVNLKLNLEKGKLYTIKSTSKQAIQQSVNGQQYAVNIFSNTVVSYKVLRQENDIMDIELKFDTIATKISSPMFNRETNSTKAGKEPIEKLMNKFSKYKLIAKISTSGKFVDFVNYHKFKDSVMMVLDSVPAAKKDQAKMQAEGLLKESAIKSMVEPFFAYLPEKAVKIGDTWETSYFRNANNISMLSANSFTLKGVENNEALVSGKSEIESMPPVDASPQMSSDLKGTITFDATIDLTTGLALHNTAKGHIEGTNTMKNNGNEMKMPMVVDSQSETIMIK
ncbi:MAG: DUF6263 family protein [Bacteroidota bacterium]|nr:DUF6263 family protein [Bacteroidota bacterium]